MNGCFFNGKWIGKYTSPMDPMGMCYILLEWLVHRDHFYIMVLYKPHVQ